VIGRPTADSPGVSPHTSPPLPRGLSLLVWLLLLLGTLPVWAGGGPTGTIVVYNPADQRSVTIAQRYQTVRGIPERNMVPYVFPTGFTRGTSWDFINSLRGTLAARGLYDQVQDIALVGVFPMDSAQGFSSYFASLECLLYYSPNYSQATAPTGTQTYYNAAFNTAQSAFNGPSPTGTFSFGKRTFSGLNFWPVSAVGYCGRSGNSPREILGIIDRAPLSDGTKPQGEIYWPLNKDVRSTTREPEIGTVAPIWSARGINSLIVGDNTGSTGWVSNRPDIMGGVVGAAAIYSLNSNNHYVPGSWVDSLTSYGAVLDSFNPGQTTCAAWLRAGVDGSSGTITEPYAYASKFPHAHIYTHFHAGASLAESFWLSLQWLAEGMCVGDPLIQPYADFPQVTITAPGNGSTVTGTIALNATAAPTNGKTLEPLLDLYVDGRRVAIESASEPIQATRTANGFQIVTTTMPDGWHDLRVVAYNADTVRTQNEAKLTLVVSNNSGQSLTLSGPATMDPDGSANFTIAQTGLNDLVSLTLEANGQTLATLPSGGGTVNIAGSLAPLDGSWTLFAVATRTNGQAIYSAPISVAITWPAQTATAAPSLGSGMADVTFFADTTAAGFNWDPTTATATGVLAGDTTNGIDLTGTLASGTITTNVPSISISNFTTKPGLEIGTWLYAATDDWYEVASDYNSTASTGSHETAFDGVVMTEHNGVFGPAHLAPGWHRLRVRTKLATSSFTQLRLWTRGGTLQDFAIINRANAANSGTGVASDSPVINSITAAPDTLTAATSTLTANATIGAGGSSDLATLVYNWVLLSGPQPTRYEAATAAFSANNSNAASTTTMTITQQGTYVLGLLVTGPAGAAWSSHTVTTTQTNTKLAINDGAIGTLLQGDTLPLYGFTVDQINRRISITGTNPSLPTVKWTTNDPLGTFSNTSPSGENTSYRTTSSSGTYTITATGVNGRTGSATASLAISSNTAATVNGSRLMSISQSGPGMPIIFTANETDSNNTDGRYRQYLWSVTAAPAGKTIAFSSTNLSTVTGLPTGSGSYTVRVDAGDQMGLNLTDSQTFTYDANGSLVIPLSIGTLTNLGGRIGEQATFAPKITGTATTIQWQISTNTGATWQTISGQTGPSLTIGPVSSADSGHMFRVIASNSLGTVTSNAATLSISNVTAGIIGLVAAPGSTGSTTSPVSCIESDGTVSVTLRRLGGSTGAVSVTATISPATATLGTDYNGFDGATQTSMVVSWADGDATDKVVSIPIINDALAEPTKVFYFQISVATGGSSLSSRNFQVITIYDDDGPGTAYFQTPSLTVSELAGTAILTVGRNFPYKGTLSVQYGTHALATDTASGGDDYTVTSGTLTWADGDSTTRQINVPILRDNLVEGDEVFTVGLTASDPTLIGSPGIAQVTIKDAPFQQWQAQQFAGALPALATAQSNPAAVRTLSPAFYLRLSETSGTTVTATDGTGNTTATGTILGTAFTLGVAGPRPPAWPGMESNNTAITLVGSNPSTATSTSPTAFQTGASVNLGTAAGMGSKLGNGGTISLWMRTSNTTQAMALVGGNQAGTATKFLLSVNQAWSVVPVVPNSLKLLIRGETTGTTAEYSVPLQGLPTGSLCDGQWHHIAVTWPKWTDANNADYMRFYFDGTEANALGVRG